jgi:hypothetical protein
MAQKVSEVSVDRSWYQTVRIPVYLSLIYSTKRKMTEFSSQRRKRDHGMSRSRCVEW